MPTATWIRNLAIALALAGIAAVGGSRLAAQQAGLAEKEVKPISAQTFLDEAEPVENRTQLSIGIFAHNLAVYLLLLAGLVSGGLTTVFTVAFNGFMLGQMFGFASLGGAPMSAAIWLVAPHGALELSLLLFAAAIGLQGPAAAIAWAAGKRLPHSRRIWRMALAGVPLLAVAATIEGYLTVPLARAALLP